MSFRVLAFGVAGLMGAAVAIVPSVAAGTTPPSTASFTAVDYAWNASGGGTTVTIAPGGTVTFSYPSGSSEHNADFGTTAPTSCTQTAGANSGTVPPLPHNVTGPGWSGTCTFNTAGQYTFHCDLHQSMTGTVIVSASTTTTGTTTTTTGTTTTTTGTTTTTTGTTTGTTGTTTGTTPTATTTASTTASSPSATTTISTAATTTSTSSGQTGAGPQSPLSGTPAGAVHIPHRQRGGTVRGWVMVSAAGAGATMSVTLRHGRARLARHRWRLHPGQFKLSLGLPHSAQVALARQGRLTIEVQLVVVSVAGRRVSVARVVVLRG